MYAAINVIYTVDDIKKLIGEEIKRMGYVSPGYEPIIIFEENAGDSLFKYNGPIPDNKQDKK